MVLARGRAGMPRIPKRGEMAETERPAAQEVARGRYIGRVQDTQTTLKEL